MKKVIVSALLVSAFGTYTWDTTEAATTAKKVPAIEAKTKKGYIKGTFDANGKALFYFDTKTYLSGGTHLKFAFDASKKATVYTSQTEYKQKDPYARYANSKKTLFFPLTWSGRQYIEVTGTKNKAFTIPYKLERLEPIREYATKSTTTGQATSLVVRLNGATKASTLSQTSRATDHETIDSTLRLEKFSYNSFIQALAAKRQLEKTKGVRYVELDQPMKLLSTDPFQSVQWALKNTGQRGGVKGADIGYHAMVKRIANKSRSTVRVAVVDTGINPTYADFAGRVRMELGYDFVHKRQLAYDDHGHGTHVAGVIAAASNNGYGMTGINDRASIIPIKVISRNNYASNSNIAKGILFAVKQKAKVINLSLGGGGVSLAIEDALAEARKKGIFVAAATGNEGASKLSYPARSKYAFSVGATNRFDKRASFSNYGEGLDLVAPGQDIASYVQDGESIFWSGTSMATPHVAGVASVLYSLKPSIKVTDVESILRKSAKDLGKKGRDTTYGYGRLNADRAVQLVK